jgi:branched-chain amino acid aminotransferase
LYLFFNNKFYEATTPIIIADDKNYRYGESVFETMKCYKGKILFFELHFERLLKALALLQIQVPKHFKPQVLEDTIRQLTKKNKLNNCRVRVTISKGNGGLFEIDEKGFQLLIENYPLPQEAYEFNENGLVTGFYDAMQKTTDAFSNYKTGNHLLYNMAALHAKQQKWNEAFVSNTNHTICDSTISNIFMVKDDSITTPPLTDGCIAGVMRQYLISQFIEKGIAFQEKSISKETLLTADEVFVTNCTMGIKWVKQVAEKTYTTSKAAQLFQECIVPLN